MSLPNPKCANCKREIREEESPEAFATRKRGQVWVCSGDCALALALHPDRNAIIHEIESQ